MVIFIVKYEKIFFFCLYGYYGIGKSFLLKVILFFCVEGLLVIVVLNFFIYF